MYVSAKWFPDFANYRRDGYDFDARFEDGLASFQTLLNSKVKSISIDTTDGKSHKLYARVEEKNFPYHSGGFNAFVARYGNN